MKTMNTLACGLIALAVCATGALAQADREGGARDGRVKGKFYKLIEKQIGEREYVGAVLTPMEGSGWATLLIDRSKGDLLARARKLDKGQVVTIGYVTEGGNYFAQWMETAARPDGEKVGDGDRGKVDGSEGDRPRAREGGDGERPKAREGEGDRERPKAREREGDRERPRTSEGGDREKPREGAGEGGDRPMGDRALVERFRRMEQRLEQLERRVRELEQMNRRLREQGAPDRADR